MLVKSLVSAACLAVAALGQTEQNKEDYPEFADNFAQWGFTWEPIKVHTDDGYTCTMFHITGTVDGGSQVTKNAVILQHGMGGSG